MEPIISQNNPVPLPSLISKRYVPSSFFITGFPTKTLCAFLPSSPLPHARCPVHLILLELMIPIMTVKSTTCEALHYAVFSNLFIISSPFSTNILSTCSQIPVPPQKLNFASIQTTDKITDLNILTLTFLNSRYEDKRFWTWTLASITRI